MNIYRTSFIALLFLSFLFVGCSEKPTDKSVSDEPKTNTSGSTTTRSSGGIETESVNFQVEVIESVTLRSKPDVSSPKVACSEGVTTFDFETEKSTNIPTDPKDGWSCSSGGCGRDITAFKKGLQLTIIAQTKNEVPVEKWSSRWYQIAPGNEIITNEKYYSYWCPEDKDVWVYGQFVKKLQ
jgi:hypothetical protein